MQLSAAAGSHSLLSWPALLPAAFPAAGVLEGALSPSCEGALSFLRLLRLPAELGPQGVNSSRAPAWPSWLSLMQVVSLISGSDRFCCESLSAVDGYPACFGDSPAVPAATARSPLELHLLQKAFPKTWRLSARQFTEQCVAHAGPPHLSQLLLAAHVVPAIISMKSLRHPV